MEKGQSDYDSSAILDFVVEAKKNTYASIERFNEAKRVSTRLKSKDLAYECGDFKYWDTYVGGSCFSGTEVVWHEDVPVWSMNYVGRMVKGEFGDQISEFLMAALAKVDTDMPYRGPAFYRDEKYTYVNSVTGNFNWFQGSEKIYYQNEFIYELFYVGGEVK